jgi:U4/U6 small nuclear ribonucleoprotein PRP4
MANVGRMYSDYVMEQRLKEVPVPTEDIDVMRYLRKLKQPICLFGEDPKDKKNRLRRLLVETMAVNIDEQEEEPETIPKFERGTEKIAEMKRFLIGFSVPRSKARKEREQQITEERIERTNEKGQSYSDYMSTASDHSDKRALSSLSSFGNMFITGSLSGATSIWGINDYSKVKDLESHNDRITGSVFINEELVATSSADKTIRLCRSDGTTCRIEYSVPVTSLAVHPSQHYLVAGLNNGCISIVDINEETELLQMKSNDGTTGSVCCHTDGGLIYSGGNDTVGRLWDLRSCKALKTMLGHNGRITCSTFDDNYHCVTGAVDNTAIVWDLRNLSRSKKIAAHTAAVSGVSVSGDILLTSSLNATLKVWSLLDFRTYATIKDSQSCILKSCFANNGEAIITASKDGLWRIYTKPLF